MPSVSNIKGALLEELVLYLISQNGYKTVDDSGGDPTLENKRGALLVKGRGESHQIDAIADYLLSPPFSFPQRLLVEAKCEDGSVGLGVVRNSVGVHKDVSEFFLPDRTKSELIRKRYHYQVAVFSANGFSNPAQNYAYAQDVFLLDLGAGPLAPLVRGLNRIKPEHFPKDCELSTVRRAFRNYLRHQDYDYESPLLTHSAVESLRPAIEQIGFAVIGMVGGTFPIFLVPRDRTVKRILLTNERLRCVLHIENGEFIFSHNNVPLLFFRLAEQLFALCFERGEFNQLAAINMKERYLSKLNLLIFNDGLCKLVQLELDPNWIEDIRDSARR